VDRRPRHSGLVSSGRIPARRICLFTSASYAIAVMARSRLVSVLNTSFGVDSRDGRPAPDIDLIAPIISPLADTKPESSPVGEMLPRSIAGLLTWHSCERQNLVAMKLNRTALAARFFEICASLASTIGSRSHERGYPRQRSSVH
jgi:hypothetical protein